jgi:mono/diheme cytochrome c family protein
MAVGGPFGAARRYLPPGMLIVIILFWVVVGLGVFFLAMHRGPKGARESPYTESTAGQRVVTLAAIVVCAFGLVVPALVLAANKNHKASVTSSGVKLTYDEQKGRELFSRSCAVCHTLQAANAVGRTGPDLDVRVGEQVSGATPQEAMTNRRELVKGAISEGRARGLGQMPALLYQGKEAEEVAAFVAAVAGH